MQAAKLNNGRQNSCVKLKNAKPNRFTAFFWMLMLIIKPPQFTLSYWTRITNSTKLRQKISKCKLRYEIKPTFCFDMLDLCEVYQFN